MLKKAVSPAIRLYILLAVSMLLLIWSAYLASLYALNQTELSVFRFINNWPDSLRPIFLVVTQLGSVWLLFVATLWSLWKHRNRLALRLFMAGAATVTVTVILKHIVARPRPSFLIPFMHLRVGLVTDHGFPSTHTAMAVVISFMLVPKKWRWCIAAFWIILVGLSRIYLGVHAPLDVVGGCGNRNSGCVTNLNH